MDDMLSLADMTAYDMQPEVSLRQVTMELDSCRHLASHARAQGRHPSAEDHFEYNSSWGLSLGVTLIASGF